MFLSHKTRWVKKQGCHDHKRREVSLQKLFPFVFQPQESIAATTPPNPLPKNWPRGHHGEVLPTGILTPTPVTARFRFAAYQLETDALVASKAVIAKDSTPPEATEQGIFTGAFISMLWKALNFFRLIMKAEVGATND